MSERALTVAGFAALAPAALYALASEHGRPFMLSFLYGPDSNHSTVGLLLLTLGLIVSPLLALGVAWRLGRRRRSLALALGVLALLLLAAGLTAQQPYSAEWTLGPAASSR